MKLPWNRPQPNVTPSGTDFIRLNTYEAWSDKALRATHALATSKKDLTSDDVWAFLAAFDVDCPTERRSMGHVLRSATTRGWLVATPYYRVSQSPATNNHGRPQRVYESKVVGDAPLRF